jgi:hypothetical protein
VCRATYMGLNERKAACSSVRTEHDGRMGAIPLEERNLVCLVVHLRQLVLGIDLRAAFVDETVSSRAVMLTVLGTIRAEVQFRYSSNEW